MNTTLNKIRELSPCKNEWEKLLNTLGKIKADDEELSLLTILNSNGIEDAIWCFRAVDGHDAEINTFARFCAKQNIEKIKPYTDEETYSLIIEWLENGDESLRSAAESAAESAARSRSGSWLVAESAEWSAAESAAWSAAESAAWSAEWSAAESAAWSAAWSAEWSVLETELRRILGEQL